MKMGWMNKINLLKRLLSQTGPLWPDSTELAGYAERGPYHCGDCVHLKRSSDKQILRDVDGRGYCDQEVMIADSEIKKDKETGLPIVNIEHGCCAFVQPPKGRA
jgi:hypothetical protein